MQPTRPHNTAHDRPSIAQMAGIASKNRVGDAHIRERCGTTANGTNDLDTSAAVRVSRTT